MGRESSTRIDVDWSDEDQQLMHLDLPTISAGNNTTWKLTYPLNIENWWLEDEMSFLNGAILGDILILGGVKRLDLLSEFYIRHSSRRMENHVLPTTKYPTCSCICLMWFFGVFRSSDHNLPKCVRHQPLAMNVHWCIDHKKHGRFFRMFETRIKSSEFKRERWR